MSTQSPVAKKRLDYQPPKFSIESVKLTFELKRDATKVTSVLKVVRLDDSSKDLSLDGEGIKLVSVALNGTPVSDFQQTDTSLKLFNVPSEFSLTIVNEINPAANASLEGLYMSAGAYCTQCEAEGFRKITYFLDRPDVLAKYDVIIYADKTEFPYLLSNGNKINSGELEDGRHWVHWQDPFKKPSYLFALVAGDFDLLTDNFTTVSGRDIALELYVDKGQVGRGQHALDSLKKAMAWDEQIYGLEYDLDIYMIVAVDFFNMGAMENKGLNVFNSKFVLADAESATDEDFFNIEAVIGHEYFHNWTGNRVTCRDWFQLSLKEGLTVFRDQQFSADMSDPLVNRISQVEVIREHQFAEDAGPMSHPIRPDEVVEMNNFYTVTVYDKGAEVIRMLHTMLGKQGFRKGMDLYFKRFDGQAVTCDDFVQAMQDANQLDLAQFRLWYAQSGTPEIEVRETYSPADGSYQLKLTQHNAATADQVDKQNLHIPVKIELIGEEADVNQIYDLKQDNMTLDFGRFKNKPAAAILGNFSAPIKIQFDCSDKDLAAVLSSAKDDFSRWDAAQTLYSRIVTLLYQGESAKEQIQLLIERLGDILQHAMQAPALSAELLSIPSFETLLQTLQQVDVDTLYNARKRLKKLIAEAFERQFKEIYQSISLGTYAYEQSQVALRRLRNVTLDYLSHTVSGEALLLKQYQLSDNMTDTLAVLKAAKNGDLQTFDSLMQDFEHKWQKDPLALDKWFAMHATAEREDILTRLELLAGHSQYQINNPNRVRSLIGSFAFYNPTGFHHISGNGYRYLTDYLLKLDKLNPQVSSRLITPLIQRQRLHQKRQDLICVQLLRLADEPELSKDLREKVNKSLNN